MSPETVGLLVAPVICNFPLTSIDTLGEPEPKTLNEDLVLVTSRLRFGSRILAKSTWPVAEKSPVG